MEASNKTPASVPEKGQAGDQGPSPSPGAADSKGASADQASPAPPAEPTFEEQQAAAAAAQSPATPQTTPEQRPQVFVGPDANAQPQSESAQAVADRTQGATQEDYDRADSDEAKEAALKESQMPNLLPGQRVQLTGEDITGVDQSGRMAYVTGVAYKDPVQAMIAQFGGSEARFAEVENYTVQTRDGRQDVLTLVPDNIKTMEINEGWGRGPF